jgi:hypothetical protein
MNVTLQTIFTHGQVAINIILTLQLVRATCRATKEGVPINSSVAQYFSILDKALIHKMRKNVGTFYVCVS